MPLQVVHDTLRVMLHDTIRAVSHDTTVLRDTFSVFKGSVPSPVRVDVLDRLSIKDWINVAVALVAALLGAIVGALLTRQASVEALENEQRSRHKDAADRLRRRVVSNLRRVARLCAELQLHESTKAFRETVGEELEVAWNLYYRVADPIFFESSNDLSERVDAFFVRIHSLAEHVKAIDAETKPYTVLTKPPGGGGGFVHLPHGTLPERRKKVSDQAQELNGQAVELLKQLETPAINAPARQ